MELYIIATPIGNLSDITYRAVETLKYCDVIICEDTRQTKKLLNHYEITDKKLVSFNARSTESNADNIFEKNRGKTLGFCSDAGTPCISDPGYRLLQSAIKHNCDIVPIPGASALTTLISVAGIPSDKFTFLGFLPHKKGRQTILRSLQEQSISVIFYESVHRFPRLLTELSENLEPNRVMVVGRELTKLHEEVFRGTIAEAQTSFTSENTRGEFVVMIAPTDFQL